jgi:hypothetical protein
MARQVRYAPIATTLHGRNSDRDVCRYPPRKEAPLFDHLGGGKQCGGAETRLQVHRI